ncbi:hypothetical protein F4777DRAFT_567492 [Nemania sp. FL0916]|nr:hypothetical protein F4777DRAFT_567492 [Nemania sp. FL0916]
MSIFEDIRNGALTKAKLSDWFNLKSTILNEQEPTTGWTPLATAVVAGFPDEVDQLLSKGADPDGRCRNEETPLLLATWKTTKERPLIVQKLLKRVSPNSIDATCMAADNNTPLMYAIEKADLDTIRMLRKADASIQIKNNDGFTAEELSKNSKSSVRNAFNLEEQSNLAKVADLVIRSVLYVINWVNVAFNGVMKMLFGISGEGNQGIDRVVDPGPGTVSPEQFVKNIDTFVKDSPVLNAFFKNRKDFIQDLAKKSVALAEDDDNDTGKPELLQKTIEVTLHQQVLYCDDSGSMVNRKGREEDRWGSQKALALRITRTTTRILPDGEGVSLQFINRQMDINPDRGLSSIEEGMNSTQPRGNTEIGTTLRDRILEPLVYSKLANKTLERPLLVSIITDGGPEPEPYDTLANVIVECGARLSGAGYPAESVKFLIGQVGSSNQAVRFLDSLKDNDQIKNVSYIFPGRLDEKFKELRDERAVDRWLIETLFEPLRAAESKN